MKILHLIDTFDCDSCTRQVQLLGPRLKQLDVAIEICCLGPETPAVQAMRRTGVIVHTLDWTRWIDPAIFWNLRGVVRESAADVIHVWRLPALRALALVAKPMLARVVMSASLPACGKLAWWDRWLLEQVQCVALAGRAEQDQCKQHDLRKPMLRVVTPAIARNEIENPAQPGDVTTIVYLGRLNRPDGARDAIWAFDILRHLYPDLRLQMVGTESACPEIRNLVDGLQATSQVEFLGERSDLPHVLRGATAVWLPRQANSGRQAALNAMAQGRVVIGSAVPSLREVICDGETGFLVPAGNVMEIARRTRLILQDDLMRVRMERAAQHVVEQQFALDDTVSQWCELYRTVAA